MLRKKIVAVSWLVILLLSTTFMAGMAMAVTDEEIQESIDLGLEWLADQQDPDGSWGVSPCEMTAVTAFALIKMQDRAYELGYGSPFDPGYEYSENVESGWDFIFIYTGEPGGGHELGADGYLDLVFHFDTQEVVEGLELCIFESGETVALIIKGSLYEEHGGLDIEGMDYVRLQAPKGKGW